MASVTANSTGLRFVGVLATLMPTNGGNNFLWIGLVVLGKYFLAGFQWHHHAVMIGAFGGEGQSV